MDIKGIRAALHREPFEPFKICLADGRELVVPHPDFVALVGERRIIVVREDEIWAVVEPLLVVSLEYGVPEKSGAPT